MSIDNQEITINLDAKRLAAITILAVISIYTLYTYSIALLAYEVPGPTSPQIVVDVFNSYTTGNVQVDSFVRGTSGRIKANLEKATSYAVPYTVLSDPSTVKVSIAVYYDDGGVVKILKFWTKSVVLEPGVPYGIDLDFSIPTNAVTGANYYANIFVWDDYLPSGGTSQIDPTNSAITVPQKNFSAT